MSKEIPHEEMEDLRRSNKFNNFVLDPKDNQLLKFISCEDGLRYKKHSKYNLGKFEGRILTFPKHSLGMCDKDIKTLADEGLYWTFNNSEMGRLRCVGCYFTSHDWDDVQDVVHRHRAMSNLSNGYYICGLLAAKRLGYEIDVDITYNTKTRRSSQPYNKPVDPTRFVIDPRDLRRMDLERTTAGIHWNGRYAKNHYRNVGLHTARYNSYPRYSVDYTNDFKQLVDSGFYWYKDGDLKYPRGVLICVHCRLKITDWEPGMNADEEHRKRNPYCEYIFHRDAGCFMDAFTYMDGENGMVKPWRCCTKHTFRPFARQAPEPAPPPAAATISTPPSSCNSVDDDAAANDLMFIDDENYADYDSCDLAYPIFDAPKYVCG